MISRGTLVAGLLALELAVVCEAFVAVRGGRPFPVFASRIRASTAPESGLREGGAHQTFPAGAHPALTIDIGYADLTILTRESSPIDVSLAPSTTDRFLGTQAPIVVRNDGGTIRIATTQRHGWSTGDDRMVTVLVPARTRIEVASAGDIRATGLRADTTLHAVGRGTVTVYDFDAPTLYVASSGSISLRQVVAARLEATSEDDRVAGNALAVRDGRIEAGDRIALGFAPTSDAQVNAETANGTIDVSGFPATSPPAIERKPQDADGSASRIVRFGAGTGRFDVQSQDGNITLSREGR